MANNKQYGLILPKKQQLKTAPKLNNIFGDDNASDEDSSTDWIKKALKAESEKNRMKKQTKLDIQKALKEDPTIYMYDEIYDDMELTKGQSNVDKHKEKKPRYIEKLLKTAERRKKEQEHRIERLVQKERDAEGEMFADKESFVTSAYKLKLEEFKKMEEEEARMSRLEAIGDVTKQQDMSGFYRHLYKQTVEYKAQDNDSENKTKEENAEQERKSDLINDASESEQTNNANESQETNNANELEENIVLDTTTNDSLKTNAKVKKVRHYRQRIIEEESDTEISESNKEIQESQTAISANKDIDKSEIQEPERKRRKQDIKDTETYTKDEKDKDLNVKDIKTSEDKTNVSENEKIVKTEKIVEMKDKSSIWKKRTMGLLFEEALQRYYTRKAMKCAAV